MWRRGGNTAHQRSAWRTFHKREHKALFISPAISWLKIVQAIILVPDQTNTNDLIVPKLFDSPQKKFSAMISQICEERTK